MSSRLSCGRSRIDVASVLNISDSKGLETGEEIGGTVITTEEFIDESEARDDGSDMESVVDEDSDTGATGQEVCEVELFGEEDVYFYGAGGMLDGQWTRFTNGKCTRSKKRWMFGKEKGQSRGRFRVSRRGGD